MNKHPGKKLTTDQFILRSNNIHLNKYEYSLVEYINYKTKVRIICSIHGEFLQNPADHLNGSGCVQCSKLQIKQTNIERYGVDSPQKSKSIQDKTKQTNIERYGVNNPFKSKDTQDKIKQTNIERYGVNNPQKSKSIRDKTKQTNIERYGVDNPFKSEKIKNKIIQTNVERYGVDSPQKSLNIQVKSKQTNLDRYNVHNVAQKHIVNILPLLNDYDWLFNQYIVEKKSTIQIANELNVDITTVCNYLRKVEIQIRSFVYSTISIEWLNKISQEQNIFIQHAGNIGEFKIPNTKFKVDGYHKESNTCYEFYGDYWHGNPDIYPAEYINTCCYKLMSVLYNKTIKRENILKSMGYNLVTIWENKYKHEK